MVGKRIRELRQARGMTQAALAKGICSRTFISALEIGRVKPSVENLQAIANRLAEPLSSFLPDGVEEAMLRLETNLNRAKALLAAGKIEEVKELWREVRAACQENAPTDALALYHEVHGELQQSDGALIQSIVSYAKASDQYIRSKQVYRAWGCRYAAALASYQAGYMDQAISLGVDAAKVLSDSEECEAKALTHYIIGCAYFAKGDVQKASASFAEARACTNSDMMEAAVLALLGECSCQLRQGQWQNALATSRKAAALAELRSFLELKAEALIAVMACSLRIGEQEEAQQVLAQIVSSPGVPVNTKCKAYREMLLAAEEAIPLQETIGFETTLGNLLQASATSLDGWERLKSEWVLEKCRLQRDPQAALARVESFADAFCRIERFKDAADTLVFGAELLKNTGETDDAFFLLRRACSLLQGKR